MAQCCCCCCWESGTPLPCHSCWGGTGWDVRVTEGGWMGGAGMVRLLGTVAPSLLWRRVGSQQELCAVMLFGNCLCLVTYFPEGRPYIPSPVPPLTFHLHDQKQPSGKVLSMRPAWLTNKVNPVLWHCSWRMPPNVTNRWLTIEVQLGESRSRLVLITGLWVKSYFQEHGWLKGTAESSQPMPAWVTTHKS